MRRWQLSPLQGGLGAHAPAWDSLNEELSGGHPMLHSDFVGALLRHFGRGDEYLYRFTEQGRPRAMCVLRRRGPGQWASFLPPQSQIGAALIPDRSTAEMLARDLPGLTGQIDILCTDPAVRDLTRDGTLPQAVTDHALTISIDLAGGFEAYWSARPRKLAANIARYARRLHTEGLDMRFAAIDGEQEVEHALARYSALEMAGWKGEAGTAVDLRRAQGQFYLDVLRAFGSRKSARVYELWLDGRLAASRIAILQPGKVVMLKTTYDESLARFAPGRLLLHHVLQTLFLERDRGGIEFCTDANRELLQWATSRRWVRHLTLYRNGAAQAVAAAVHVFDRGAAPALPQVAHAMTARGAPAMESYRHPREFPDDVRELFEAAERENFASGLLWFEQLLEGVFPGDVSARICVAREGGRPVAALPVVMRVDRGRLEAHALANFYTPLYQPVIADDASGQHLLELIRGLRAQERGIAAYRFGPMDRDSRGFQALKTALIHAGLVPFEYFCFGNWSLDAAQRWDDYLAARDGMLRSTIRRMSRRFQSDGGRIELICDPVELERALSAYQQVYAASWKQAEPFPQFVPGLIRACARAGWLRLGIAWLGEQPVAVQFWITCHGRAHIYKLAYDARHQAYAPGTLLTAHMIEHAMRVDGVAEIDYLMGDDRYKQSWMSRRRERWGLMAYDPARWQGLTGLARELVAAQVRRLRRRAPATEALQPAMPA